MSLVQAPAQTEEGVLRTLPLVTLHLTNRCNSRCISCDFWRHGRTDVSLESVKILLPSLARLGTRTVLISGGEPLVHPEWMAISETLRNAGLELWLLTAGLALAKHATKIARFFQSVTVSLDGADSTTYRAIRGVDAFEPVCAGIRALSALGTPVSVRVTVQRANYRDLHRFVSLARELGACQVSFLAADVSNGSAFGRETAAMPDIALRPEDLPALAETLDRLEVACAQEFAAGFIAESPHKLRRLLAYYRALCGLGDFPPVRCNAPEFSAVIEADGRLRPCFFIAGSGEHAGDDLSTSLNSPRMTALRHDIRAGLRPECRACVCSMWRDPATLEVRKFRLESPEAHR